MVEAMEAPLCPTRSTNAAWMATICGALLQANPPGPGSVAIWVHVSVLLMADHMSSNAMRSASLRIKLKSPSFGIAVVVTVDVMVVILVCMVARAVVTFFQEAKRYVLFLEEGI
jgi:hypothetical protein